MCTFEIFFTKLHTNIFDIIVANDNPPEQYNKIVEAVEVEEELSERYAVYKKDLLDTEHPWRHDPLKIASVLIDLYRERTGPLTLE